MNFFGHAVLASRRDGAPGFVLGSMLPDFAAMSGARVDQVHRPDLAAGVDYHHRTDAVFHAAPSFRAQLARGTRALRARGVHRGGAMGAAHVGVELLLDGVLAADPVARSAYLAALAVDLEGAVSWATRDGHERFRDLVERLADHGVPDDYGDPDVVAGRVARVLSRRPRLSLNPDDVTEVRNWLREIRPSVTNAAPQLVADVWAELQGAP